MSLLIACATSWWALLAAFAAVWQGSAQPRTAADLLVLCVIGTAALLFGRIGLVSTLALAVGLIPRERLRRRIATPALRFVPLLLRSSVLAAISAGLLAQSAHSAPLSTVSPLTTAQASTAPRSPEWPTTPGQHAQPPLDPAWPTTPSREEAPDRTAEEPPDRSAEDVPDESPEANPDGPREEGRRHDSGEVIVHIVAPGESLWTIAAAHSAGSTAELVRDIHRANREAIGPDPNLIMPGQRLEIDP